MASTAGPNTPPKSESTTIHSTPYNDGTAANAEYNRNERLERVKHGLWKDISKKTISNIDFNDMLKAMVHMVGGPCTLEDYLEQAVNFVNAWRNDTSPSPSSQVIEDSNDFRQALGLYCKAKSESDMYDPLTDALNAILRRFRRTDVPKLPKASNLDIVYKVNDPVVIKSSRLDGANASKRKPDIITLTESTLKKLQGSHKDDDWEKLVHYEQVKRSRKPKNKSLEEEAELTWLDPLKVLELKFLRAMLPHHLKDKYDAKTQLEQLTSLLIPASPEDYQRTPIPSLTVPGSSTARSSSASRSSYLNTPQSNAPRSGEKRNSDTDDSGPQKKAKTYDPSKIDVTVQLAAYTTERLLAAPWITRTPGIIIQDQMLYLWWYDKQHCFQSKGINFFKSLPYFVVLIVLFQRLESQDWGLADQALRIGILEVPVEDPSASISRPSLPRNAKQVAENLIKKFSIGVGNHTFSFMLEDLKTDFVLFGRSTSTVVATNPSDGENYHLKFSWQESCRPREALVIQTAREIGAEEGVLGNLPLLIAHAELDFTSTAKLTEQLGFSKDADEVKGSRVLCILAFDILQPITSLEGKELWKAYWEIIKCHYILWKGGIQHGDISVSNLMHRNGTGVLNDFDLARLTSSTTGSGYRRGFDRTGTKPFLALDLLTADAQAGKVERRYRHDLESFLWVLMWITACYDSGVESIPADHSLWLIENVNVCRAAKKSILGDRKVITKNITNSYRHLSAVTMVLNQYWANLHIELQNQTFSPDFSYALAQSAGASSPESTPVIMEPTDEEVLSNMLRAFTSHPMVDHLRPSGLLDYLPSIHF